MERKHRWSNLIWQPLCATVFIFLVLICFRSFAATSILWAVGAGSLASSCYIVFGSPCTRAAEPKVIIWGYIIGMVSGDLIRWLMLFLHPQAHPVSMLANTEGFLMYALLASISVTLTLFVMSILNLKHPPAAGMALVLVLDLRNYSVLAIILVSAILLAILKHLLKNHLIDLQ